MSLIALLVIAGAQAVHDDGYFELDKNTADSPPGGADDWDNVYAQIAADANSKCTALGAVECAFASDPQGTSIFTTGGSKDDLDISSWKHTSGNVPPKDEITNAYAAKYTSAGSQILYFGADRYATSGSADFGFWFLHNEVVALPNGTFSGVHQAKTATERGDVLVLGTFTQGGATSNIRVFEWVGTGGNATSNGTVAGPTGAFGDCVPGIAGDKGCGTVNNANITVAWPYAGKAGGLNEITPGGFVEGGIDLTALGLDGCFSSFIAETRSSPSVDAQLKDFVLGTFESCGSSTVTTPKLADGTTDIPSEGTSITTAGSIVVKDSAVITVDGTNTFGGSVSFRLCGPTPLTDANYTLCSATTGAAVGAAKPVSGPSPATVVSDAATITSAGRYCFSATYSGDPSKGVPGSGDSSVNECFKVLPVPTSISTQASAGPVTLGTAIDDTATLSGTALDPDGSKADGTITFSLYGPDDATCATTIATRVVTLTNGGDGNYKASDGTGSGSLTPTAAGTYRWIASYSGDLPNTLPVSGSCNDANEAVVVSPKQPSIVTVATPGPVPVGTAIDDTATLSGTALDPDGSKADGTITFSLYGPDDATCATTIATRVVTLTNGGDGNYKASDGTGSGSLTPTAAGTYRWIASYSGDLPNTLPVSGSCNDPDEASLVISLQPTIVTAQSFVPNDQATIEVVSGGNDLAGSVRFRLYDNVTCSGTALYDSGAIDIATGTGNGLSRTVKTANTTAYTANQTFSWLVEYTNTNPAHKNVTSACNKESSSITIDNDTTSP